MKKLIALALLLIAQSAVSLPLNFIWNDNNPGVATTFELTVNGVLTSGIVSNTQTVDIPILPGQLLDARVRAFPPAGFKCGTPLVDCPLPTDYATLAAIFPSDPTNFWAIKTWTGVTSPMAITVVQSITGAGTTIALSGVAAGNTLIMIDSYHRSAGATAEALPTDSNGTFAIANSDVPPTITSDVVGVGIFYVKNTASGTHTVTPEANTIHHTTLMEVSGLDTTAPLDVNLSAKTSFSTITSQATGTTGATSTANELVVIALGLAASTGNANVVLTNPVTGFTTLQILNNDATDIAMMHAWKTISSTGTQTATFNWTDNEAGQSAHAAIATFKAAAGVTATSMPPKNKSLMYANLMGM